MSVYMNFTKVNLEYLTYQFFALKHDFKKRIWSCNLVLFYYVTEFAWLVEPEGMPMVEHEAEGGNDE